MIENPQSPRAVREDERKRPFRWSQWQLTVVNADGRFHFTDSLQNFNAVMFIRECHDSEGAG